jgi:DNA-binding NarL/FixJ family response regulator
MILGSADDIEVVGEADDGAVAAGAVAEHNPDVVLMDIRMPGLDGITATQRLRSAGESPRVVVLTTFHVGDEVLRALRAGADGFLLKDSPPDEILQAIRRVAAGDAMLSPAVTKTVLEHVGDAGTAERLRTAQQRLAELTPREREVAVAVASGASNAEIGGQLYLSEATVKAHVSRLLTKLTATNRVQIAIVVHDAGLA